MSTFALILFCAQACLVQNIYSQCIGAAGSLANGYHLGYGAGIGIGPSIAPGLGASDFLPFAGLAPTEALGAYGGSGIGNLVAVGELPVAGTTLVAGQVPILGAVRFAGELPATGTVSISGSCGCGCGAHIY